MVDWLTGNFLVMVFIHACFVFVN